MVVYNFKSITVVPTAKDMIDIILSKTQRKTPTVVHPKYAISRIRAFYMRKVKYTSQNYHDKLSQVLSEFPVLDEIHPFYADLMNVLYDRDHYKLALGQLNTARSLIDNLAKDYLRLLKYGDSLYRCKQLKRAALGRMCTLMKRQAPNLAYLEQVRQHLARLPSIDPNARTLIICGYPNVGKSSFMNNVTRADVEVQPYAFTTKSLFLGHTDYRYLRWQVIDTPGILDHPLEERNTIEMQSITALAHLRASILFLVDISEQCGYSIKQQVDLFNSIKPLFTNKPLIVAFNKIDACPYDQVPEESRKILDALAQTAEDGTQNVFLHKMSTMTGEGVSQLKELACDKLLEQRVESKLASRHLATSMNRLHTALPLPRDSRDRSPFVPQSVVDARAEKQKKMSEKKRSNDDDEGDEDDDDMLLMGDEEDASWMSELNADEKKKLSKLKKKNSAVGAVTFHTHKANTKLYEEEEDDWDPTIFGPDYREHYILANDEWKFDAIPEFIDGKNIADYIDADILDKLDALEREEEEREKDEEERINSEMVDYEELNEEEESKFKAIKNKKKLIVEEHRGRKTLQRTRSIIPRTQDMGTKTDSKLEDHLLNIGLDPTRALKRTRSQSKSSRSRSMSAKKQRTEPSPSRSKSRDPSQSAARSITREGFSSVAAKDAVVSLAKRKQSFRNKQAKKGEGDRVIVNMKPKHLFAGKRTIGKNQRR